jgi:hypothetical protein
MTTTSPDVTFQSPRLQKLAADLTCNPTPRTATVEAFWSELAETGTPLIERLTERSGEALVTFVWRETEDVQAVHLTQVVSWNPRERRTLTNIEGTDIWYLSWWATDTLRATYGFSTDHEACPFVVTFDGERDNNAPHVLDALIADEEIPPVVAILVDQIGIRNQELPCNPDFARAIATEPVHGGGAGAGTHLPGVRERGERPAAGESVVGLR